MNRQMILGELQKALTEKRFYVNSILDGYKDWVIFDIGNTSELYQKAFEIEGIRPRCYIDNAVCAQGQYFHGVPALSPSELIHYSDAIVLICSDRPSTATAIGKELEERGVQHLRVAEVILSAHVDEILANAEVLDDESLIVYADVILAHLYHRPIHFFDRNQYFSLPNFAGCREKEVFVDVGAYVGDSVERYILERMGIFDTIYAIEPNPNNLKAMTCRFKRLREEWAFNEDRIHVLPFGIGKESRKGHVLLASGTNANYGSHVVENEGEGEVFSIHKIDELFSDTHIGFLKADIESYEMDMLYGAMEVIQRDRPNLAICIYHNASDLYQILSYLRKELIDYCFAIRHHSSNYAETVLYAYPKETSF